ncbi:hypothetical protein F5888DRAFT_1636149 [Russula emetica]|nr:hypothetical protein F5888DRAFT_1636149 [Russula emetica]
MSDANYRLWCFVKGDNTVFSVTPSSSTIIDDLRENIKEKSLPRPEVGSPTTTVPFRSDAMGCDSVTPDVLRPNRTKGHNCIVQEGSDKPVESGFMKEYDDIFIKVNGCGAFKSPDIEKNRIHILCSEDCAPVPEFVAKRERELDSKRGIWRSQICPRQSTSARSSEHWHTAMRWNRKTLRRLTSSPYIGGQSRGKKFIAKKVREQSNELKIFEFLNTFQPKSEHIISLHESFQTTNLMGRTSTSWLVDGRQCGTKGWMATEIEEKSMYSPIKADRWSGGKVLLYLLNVFRKEDRWKSTEKNAKPPKGEEAETFSGVSDRNVFAEPYRREMALLYNEHQEQEKVIEREPHLELSIEGGTTRSSYGPHHSITTNSNHSRPQIIDIDQLGSKVTAGLGWMLASTKPGPIEV